jgi:radical SAM superfamily enzyme YgiQ (UPF0313 family)
VLLIRPWRHGDAGVAEHDLANQWRNGPYSLLLLAAILRRAGHEARVADLERELVRARGDVAACLAGLRAEVARFAPHLAGVGFFSVHYEQAGSIVAAVREAARATRMPAPLLVAGGIHATVATESCLAPPPRGLGFDCACVGEADVSLARLADGAAPATVPGVAVPGTTGTTGATGTTGTAGTTGAAGAAAPPPAPAERVAHLDDLPRADWALCDHGFYSAPTAARVKFRTTRSLDLIMGRGCGFRCAFCAYGALSRPRYHSADYVLDEIAALAQFTTGVYFLDSTLGTNRRLLEAVCAGMLARGLHKRVEWYANMRSDQVDEELLRLMWAAGCRYLFYGFESGSQRALERMAKRNTVENNVRAAELHNRLRFPYNASVLVNYPGDTEEDLAATRRFLEAARPPSVGVNWYVPLPGSTDYAHLLAAGRIDPHDPAEWRRVGEVNGATFYADADEAAYRARVAELEDYAYRVLPEITNPLWRGAQPA